MMKSVIIKSTALFVLLLTTFAANCSGHAYAPDYSALFLPIDYMLLCLVGILAIIYRFKPLNGLRYAVGILAFIVLLFECFWAPGVIQIARNAATGMDARQAIPTEVLIPPVIIILCLYAVRSKPATP